jgi:CBS domain-containing protein
LSENSKILDAIHQMQTQRVGCVLVCRDEKVTGILTEVDVLRKVGPGEKTLYQPILTFMTHSPISITPETSIWEAAKKMKEGGFRHLPVINQQGQPEGFVSIRNLVTFLADQFPETIYTLPPDPNKVPPAAEGA